MIHKARKVIQERALLHLNDPVIGQYREKLIEFLAEIKMRLFIF